MATSIAARLLATTLAPASGGGFSLTRVNLPPMYMVLPSAESAVANTVPFVFQVRSGVLMRAKAEAVPKKARITKTAAVVEKTSASSLPAAFGSVPAF